MISFIIWVVGLVLAIVSAFIFLGGVSRLASVTEKLVPFMALLYIIGGIIVLVRIIVIFTEIIKVIAGHFWTQCPKV